MSLSSVGGAMGVQAQVNTLEQVNMSLIKTANNQAEQQVSQLLQSVSPTTSTSDDSRGQHVDIYV
ncbi:putative motility protein [Psychromonas aquimarina]|uniref:putative motility protein n=1 Tax=Psychromonas aquimarina TaxID=444919 RepID=UPI00041D26A3|nr:putative motility protein [Psychromonas aquimarina]